MVLTNRNAKDAVGKASRNDQGDKLARVRLAGEICNGRYRSGESLRLSEIAARYHLDSETVSKMFAEFQTLGMVTLWEQLRQSCNQRARKRCKKPMRYELLWRKSLDAPQLRCSRAGLPSYNKNWMLCARRFGASIWIRSRNTT